MGNNLTLAREEKYITDQTGFNVYRNHYHYHNQENYMSSSILCLKIHKSIKTFCARDWQWNPLTWSTIPSREDNTVGWMSLCMCMIREQRHMEGVARMGPVSPPPAVWLPWGCWGCADVDWSPASNISDGHCVPLQMLFCHCFVRLQNSTVPCCCDSPLPAICCACNITTTNVTSEQDIKHWYSLKS